MVAGSLQPKVASRQQLTVAPAWFSMQPMVVAKERAREDFSQRLQEALADLGIGRFAQQKQWLGSRFKISGEAARKWLQGIALPDQARWGSLADGLGVRAEWLRDGILPKVSGTGVREPVLHYGDQSQPVKLDVLTLALTIVSTELTAKQLPLKPQKFAEVVAIAYEALDEGMPEARLIRIVRTAIN
jgi:hypothetical protein